MWVELEALLSQNVSFPPRAATPGTLQTLPGWEREVSLFAFQAFQLAGKKKKQTTITNIKAKASSPLKGRRESRQVRAGPAES